MSPLGRTEQLLLQKKRKLDQSLERGESSVDHGQRVEKNIHHNVKKLVANLSCATSFADIMGDSLDEQTIHNSCISSTGVSTSIEGYEEKHSTNSCSTPSIVDLVSLMDGSVHDGSNSWSQQDMASRNQPPEDPSDYSDGSDISDVDEESNVTIRRRVFSLLYLDDEYPTRPVVPIGPAFQAEIPVRVGTCTKNNCDTLESTKYIGIRFWPSEDRINETLLGSNGPGRHELCSRKSPGSANRMKRRVYKSTRKFDEMGEEVSKTWTMREENQFETLMKTNPPVNQASFWDKASKCIPTKTKNSILSYYYNVYIRKRSNMQLRSSTEQIISDNNQPESEE